MRIIKYFKYMILCVSILAIAVIGTLMGVGYKDYQEVINVISVEAQVERIREDAEFISIEAIDEDFLNAIIAVEDRRFYKHGAVDSIGLMRAVITNLKEGKFVQGGSTITQQLAKNMYFDSEQTLIRKVAELFVATDLERLYEKDEILELYINKIYFGDGCYGIGEASQHFLGKAPSDLTVEEAAMLAGLPQSPTRYANNKELAWRRQQVVLSAMEHNGYIQTPLR